MQPKQKPNADSKNANIIRIVSNAKDSTFIPNNKKINMDRETARPIAWANLFGGPGTIFSSNFNN